MTLSPFRLVTFFLYDGSSMSMRNGLRYVYGAGVYLYSRPKLRYSALELVHRKVG